MTGEDYHGVGILILGLFDCLILAVFSSFKFCFFLFVLFYSLTSDMHIDYLFILKVLPWGPC